MRVRLRACVDSHARVRGCACVYVGRWEAYRSHTSTPRARTPPSRRGSDAAAASISALYGKYSFRHGKYEYPSCD